MGHSWIGFESTLEQSYVALDLQQIPREATSRPFFGDAGETFQPITHESSKDCNIEHAPRTWRPPENLTNAREGGERLERLPTT